MHIDKRLIVALDVHSMAKLSELVIGIGEHVSFYKVGMELFYGNGYEVIRYLKENRKMVFLDLKLCDIPNTVAKAMEVLVELGVDMVNVHASGGFKMMQAAAQAVQAKAKELGIKPPKLIAVTVLTSMTEDDFHELNYNSSISEQVVALAKLAQKAGLDGVVASPQESKLIKEACGKDFLIVTPGVRPTGSDLNDQSRITTPKEALHNGSTHLVIGRPITQSTNPKETARNIINEMVGV